MEGLMMDYPLTTNTILEYGNSVYHHKKIISHLPDGTRHEYRFGDMYKRCKRLANALVHKLGITNGNMVGTFAWNHGPHVELYYAISGIGAVCQTINIRLSSHQIEYIINNSEDKVIFVDATLVPLLEKIAPLLETVEYYILLNAPKDFTTTLPNTLHYEDLLAEQSEDFEWPKLNENDACGMCYTSGTTGLPKGVLYSHRSTFLHASTIISPNAGNFSNSDTVLLIVPQFHVMAWGFPYLCLLSGSNMVLPSSHLQPDSIIKILQEEKVTKANGVPTIWLGVYHAMKMNPPKDKLALEEYLVGGSALPKSLIEGFEKDFGIKGVQAWGMTETSPLGTVSRLQPKHAHLSASEKMDIRAKQGLAFPGVELRIVMEDGTLAPTDGKSMGELHIKGAWTIQAYFKTNNSESFTEDGWFKTGDVCTLDEDGYMEIKDRTKDLIKSGGEWISSVALESALMAHPKIKEAAVIAIPDAKWVEKPLALIVLVNQNDEISDGELIEFLSRDFVNYQIPKNYVYVHEVPKTSVGKFDKKEIRRLFAEGVL
ncbi:long-chain fatty acid--CoA ligase [Rhodonellum psychrophilum GCM71 = DSM 17998]|uniref:Long-chain fatty acid--CoA ligase n=2 Tax=Rhodonellum TaxID=336827 RepID=U5BRL9_9BACT|nr:MULTISPECIES: long-chain fatty acid--CoA ligase [Rhodonellum]ERM80533.1 long-chain fatty acid--CoA ligase [Rhodonellum psychrophilum GCM71 = DSM 17998]SDZ31579.1 fatty-acyl-CoA synthase [Rhodonellum ikkaensis]